MLKGGLESYVMVAVHCTHLQFVLVLTVFYFIFRHNISH